MPLMTNAEYQHYRLHVLAIAEKNGCNPHEINGELGCVLNWNKLAWSYSRIGKLKEATRAIEKSNEAKERIGKLLAKIS